MTGTVPSTIHEIDLAHQVAVVTGGGRGIGRAIAQALASAGAVVAVLARSKVELDETVRLIEQSGGRAKAFPVDVSDPEPVQSILQDVERDLGPVDILVNNAAVIGPLGPFQESNVQDWWRAMEVNLRGPLLLAHAVLPGMTARHRGRIINVASGAGTISAPFFSGYVTSKTALIRFTECLALETQPHGIACFAVEPGTVRTSMADYSLNSAEGKKWLPWFPKIFEQKIDVPPERAAQLVLTLASGSMDALSGRLLSIHEDLNALLAAAEEIRERNLFSLKMERLKMQNPGVQIMAKK